LAAEHPATSDALSKLPGVSRITPPLPNEARYTLTFDRAQVSPNSILRTVLEAGGEVVSFTEDVKHLNQAFMDLTEPGVRT
jgi:ABC-2 type transport system ATP-binding protein